MSDSERARWRTKFEMNAGLVKRWAAFIHQNPHLIHKKNKAGEFFHDVCNALVPAYARIKMLERGQAV